jgi:thiol-disulfide isomerase/thioredoxin
MKRKNLAALTIGDPAPALLVSRFVKGTPVTRFEPGRLYVVEFWATWCAPCRDHIPHLTALQKQFKEVVFIGVSIFEETPEAVAPFVKKMGARMDYRVAMDRVPPGKDNKSGLMAQTWMAAAAQEGIPKTFIIDKQGRLAWVGHPALMDEPLRKVVAGTWDIASEAAKVKRQQRLTRAHDALRPKIRAAYDEPIAFAKRAYNATQLMDRAIAEDPELEEVLGLEKFRAFLYQEKFDEAAAYGESLVTGAFRENYRFLHQLSMPVVDLDSPSNPDLKKVPTLVAMALKAALRADVVCKQTEWAIADTLAAAYFVTGQLDQAIRTQERALPLGKKRDAEVQKLLADHLALYKNARKPR